MGKKNNKGDGKPDNNDGKKEKRYRLTSKPSFRVTRRPETAEEKRRRGLQQAKEQEELGRLLAHLELGKDSDKLLPPSLIAEIKNLRQRLRQHYEEVGQEPEFYPEEDEQLQRGVEKYKDFLWIVGALTALRDRWRQRADKIDGLIKKCFKVRFSERDIKRWELLYERLTMLLRDIDSMMEDLPSDSEDDPPDDSEDGSPDDSD